jgi:hypothetical protein
MTEICATSKRSTLETMIPCLNIDSNKKASKETGYYIGRPVSDSRQSSTSQYVYAATNNGYLRNATPDDSERWNLSQGRYSGK